MDFTIFQMDEFLGGRLNAGYISPFIESSDSNVFEGMTPKMLYTDNIRDYVFLFYFEDVVGTENLIMGSFEATEMTKF